MSSTDPRKRDTLKLPGITVEVIHREPPKRHDRRDQKAFYSKPKIYFNHESESILQNMLNRTSRPTSIYRGFLGLVRLFAGFDLDTKITWSQYAGCSCPCSPGFVVDSSKRIDVWVTLTSAPATTGGWELTQRALALGVAPVLS